MRWPKAFPVLLLTLLVGCSTGNDHASGYAVIPVNSRPASPAFIGTNWQGQADQTGDLLGNVVLVNLEYPGDVNAGAQRSELRAAAHTFSGRDLSLVRVTEQFGPVKVITAVVQGYIISFPDQVVLHERRQAITLGLSGLPYLLVLDRRGRIAARVVGVVDPARLRSTLVRLIAET